MKKNINAKIVADSLNEFGDRVVTYLLTYIIKENKYARI